MGRLLLVTLRNPRVPVAEGHEAFLGQLGDECLAQGTVEQGVGLGEAADGKGEVDQAELLDDARERRGGRRRHLLDAALQGGLLLHFVAELGGRELLHLHLAAALGREQFGEALHAEAHRMVGIVEVAEADHPFLLGPGRGDKADAQAGDGKRT